MRIVTLSQLSLAGSSGIAEVKVPLWWADGTNTSTSVSSGGSAFLQDGGGSTGTAKTLFTLSSNWPSTLKFALECTVYTSNSSYAANVEFWDITSNSGIGTSACGTMSTTATVIRSNQVTLTPGHSYGVTFWNGSSSYTAYLSDASLIIFP